MGKMKMCGFLGYNLEVFYPCDRFELEAKELNPIRGYTLVNVRDKKTGQEYCIRFDDYGANPCQGFGYFKDLVLVWLCIKPPFSIHQFVILPTDCVRNSKEWVAEFGINEVMDIRKWVSREFKERIKKGEVCLDEIIKEYLKNRHNSKVVDNFC